MCKALLFGVVQSTASLCTTTGLYAAEKFSILLSGIKPGFTHRHLDFIRLFLHGYYILSYLVRLPFTHYPQPLLFTTTNLINT